jgi:hypothetical protein
MHLSRPFVVLASVSVLACRDRTTKPAASTPPRGQDSVLAEARRTGLADTSSPAYQQLNLMSAPIQVVALTASESDTLRWTAQADSCGLLVVSRHVPVQASTPSDNAFLVAEWFGSAGFGAVWDIAPSPKWDWIAYGQARRINADRDVDTAATETKTTRAQLLAQIIHSADGAKYLAIPVIEPLLDTCSGDECPLDAASPLLGGARVGWNDDGTVALVSGAENPPHWTSLRPGTRDRVAASLAAPAPIKWASRAIPDIVKSPQIASGGGAYRFESRYDSVFVVGPDRNGVKTTRYVGPGIPVTATRNGQYLLAVRPEQGTWRAVIYEFVLFHAMMTSNCDRPDAH